jgi:tetratricopeptide (TPR) repeat protein
VSTPESTAEATPKSTPVRSATARREPLIFAKTCPCAVSMRSIWHIGAEVAVRSLAVGFLGAMLLSVAVATEPDPPATSVHDEALLAGDCRAASEGYVLEASSNRDPRIAVRAIDVARACHHLPAAWQAAERLWELDPENPEALRLIGVVALESWRLADARRAFSELIAKPDVDAELAWEDIVPSLAEGPSVHAAWQVLNPLVNRAVVSPNTLAALARLACNADNFQECRALLEAAGKAGLAPDARLIRLSANVNAGLGDAEAALAEAGMLARADPRDHAFAAVEVLIFLDRLEDARTLLQEIRRLANEASVAPIVHEADRRLALLAQQQGQWALAESLWRARLDRDQGAGEAIYYLSILAERRGDSDKALQGYQQLVAAGAGLAPRARAARWLLEKGEIEQAQALFDEWARSGRNDAVSIEITRSRVLADSGRVDLALTALDRALERFPDHHDLLYQRAIVHELADDTSAAIKEFETLLQGRPDDAGLLNALGYTLADRGRELKRAERLIRQALEQRPDNAAFLDSLGWVLYRRGQLQEARPILERAWRLSREPEIGAHLGELLWVQGEEEAARRLWRRAVQSAPDSKLVQRTIEKFLDATP